MASSRRARLRGPAGGCPTRRRQSHGHRGPQQVQSDKQVAEIVDPGDLERKFAAFGWFVRRCNGHDFSQIADVMDEFETISSQPQVLIADTIKGRGVSFNKPTGAEGTGGYYRWHAGAPDDDSFQAGHTELVTE